MWTEPTGGWQARLQPAWSPASSVCVGWQVSAAAFALQRSAGSRVKHGAQVGSRADPGTPPPLPFRGSHAIAAILPFPAFSPTRSDSTSLPSKVGRVGAAPTAGWCGEALFWQQWRRGLRDDRHRANCTHCFHAQRVRCAACPFPCTPRLALWWSARAADQMLLPSRQRELTPSPCPPPAPLSSRRLSCAPSPRSA